MDKIGKEVRRPFIGLFWIINGKVLSHLQKKTEGRKFLDTIMPFTDHEQVWCKYKNQCISVPPDIEMDISKTYYHYPRGRVYYHIKEEKYIIITGSFLARNDVALGLIRDEFNLSIDNSRVEVDAHYEPDWSPDKVFM